MDTGMTTGAGNGDDREYDQYLARLNTSFINAIGDSEPLFTTDADGLFDLYLRSIPDSERQYHNCNACKEFINKYGGLVTIDDLGVITPAVWVTDDAPDVIKRAVYHMWEVVRKAKVTGSFLSSDKVWGKPTTGVWHHLFIVPPTGIIYNGLTLTASQKVAEKREDYKTVSIALGEFGLPALQQVVTLLESDALYRNEKVLGPATWLRDLQGAVTNNKARRSNLIWKAVATAPAGFCHPRSSMIGTLLDDIAYGLSFDEVSRRFSAKMHPLRYQRPQAAPAAGAIAAAEKIVAQLGASGSLARRFARPDEVRAIWIPTPPKVEAPLSGSVFRHLMAKGDRADTALQDIPVPAMTWSKFRDTVLPTAEKIEWFASSGPNPIATLVTAINADAPPILQWDTLEHRNPVSWYFHHGGSLPEQFDLQSRVYHEVTAVTYQPSMWNARPDSDHHGKGVMFVVKGAADKHMNGLALFPETLKSEFHGIRSVIEAHSDTATIEGAGEPMAAGVMLQATNRKWNITLRVTVNGQRMVYKLDRWD